MLLDADSAGKRLGRSPYTITGWQYRGLLTPIRCGEPPRIHYEAAELLAAARRMRANYRERRFVAGPGRGHRSDLRGSVVDALALGMSTRETAEHTGASMALVSIVRREVRADVND